jgi:hypothetical protein
MSDELRIEPIPIHEFTAAEIDVLAVLLSTGLMLTKRVSLEEMRAKYPASEANS